MHMHKFDEWVSVSQQDLNEVESKEQRGIKLQFMFSPADLPTAWRAYQKGNLFVVEFKYLSESESRKLEPQEQGIVLEVGKNSKRIYKISFDFLMVPSSGELVIKRAADSIGHAHGLNKNNSEVIQKFLSSKYSKPEILHRFGG